MAQWKFLQVTFAPFAECGSAFVLSIRVKEDLKPVISPCSVGAYGEILVYAQCPSCPLPFCPSEMPFPQNDLPFNALHQNALSEMPFWKCPFRYVLHQNALSVMPIQICPFKNALSQFALSQFALYQIAVYHECNIFIYFRL